MHSKKNFPATDAASPSDNIKYLKRKQQEDEAVKEIKEWDGDWEEDYWDDEEGE